MKILNPLFLFVVFTLLVFPSLIYAQAIYISELSYNPCSDQGNDGDCEYVIISNNEATAVDISDYSISNGFDYTFPAGTTIPAGGSISLGISADCAAGTFDLSGGWSGSMSNSNDETIEILDANGNLISAVTYDGTIGDGDCMANCFDANGTVSACASSILAGLDCPGLGNDGDACIDVNGGDSIVDATDCTCPVVCPSFGTTCTDSDGDASTIDGNCNCTEVVMSDLFISELSFNPCANQGNDGDCEYIVITNNGTEVVDLTDYTIGGGFTYTFPAGTTIPLGSSISLGISDMCPAGTFDLSGGWTGSMSNSNDETIEIIDAGGTLISAVTYNGSIADGDCMANCFDAGGVVSACVSTILGEPTFDCPDLMVNIGDTCTDSDGDTSTFAADCTCTEITITFDCPDLMANIGDACDDGDASTNNDLVNAACLCEGSPIIVNCPASAKINEFHYDNSGTDVNEFIEIALPTGSEAASVQIDLINGGNGSSYSTYILSTTDLISSDATFDYYVWNPTSIQNGGPDGMAVSCTDGTLYQFLSYEGVISGVGAPVDGATSTDVGVVEGSNNTETQSIMCDGAGNFLANCTADPGAANNLSTCITEGCTDPTACNFNDDANVDDGSCLLPSGCDTCDGMGGITDNPEVGELCDDGNPMTNYDIIQQDCTCAGSTQTFDCPALQANVGDACDDGNPATENDMINDECACSGTPLCIADFVVAEVTCDSIPGGPESYTVNINFTGGGFDMFTIEPNAGEIAGIDCRCEGVVPPPPGDLIISELSFNPCSTQGNDSDCEYFVLTNIGANTIDLSAYTISNAFSFTFPQGTFIASGQDITVGISENCPNANFDITGGWSGSMGNGNAELLLLSDSLATLIGVFTYDTSIADGDCMAQCFDNLGTPSACLPSVFAAPDCPDLMLSIGDTCDDMDASTGNDTVQADCTCSGITYDCPDLSAFFGDTCDDADITTQMDQVQADCTCAGIPTSPPGDIVILELSFNPCETQGPDGDCEYILIQNNSANDIDLTAWSIGMAFDYSFPDGTIILAGETLSIGRSNNCAVATFDLGGGWDGSLGNAENETIFIVDAVGEIISIYTYDANIADGDCMVQCFDATANPSSCESTVYGDPPPFDCSDLMAYIGDDCNDNNEMTVMDEVQADCTCAGVLPTFDCLDLMVDIGDACDDGNANTLSDMIILGADNPDLDAEGTIVITTIPNDTDLVFTITSANGCSFDINVPSPMCDPVLLDCPTSAKINEFHYDNADTDVNEFVEIALSAGSDPTLIQIDLINGSTNASYDTYVLTTNEFVSTDGTNDYYVWNPTNLQNGPDGIALSCIDGTLYQFISYEGVITGIGAPVDGLMSTDIGVSEDANNTETQSIMCDGTGVFVANCTADPGSANDLSTCIEDVLGCTDPTACNFNENANVNEGCVFADGCDECDGMGGVTDNPEVGELCDDGNAATNYDVIQPDCTCMGTTETFDCPELIANVGDACDDENPATENDAVTDECVCAGTPICVADFTIGEVNCETETNGTDSYSVDINFTGAGFDMFTIEPNAGIIEGLDCRCEGVTPPPPGDLIISELSFNPCAEQGSDGDCEYFVLSNNGNEAIDISGYSIGNAFTFNFPGGIVLNSGQSISVGISADCPVGNFGITGGWSGSMSNSNNETLDLIDANGVLIGAFTYNGNLGDGNCLVQCFDSAGVPSECASTVLDDPIFDCPDLMLNIGAECDDMDDATGNDVVSADCVCAGEPFDCPDLSAFVGDTCDDGDEATFNDMVTGDCTCAGMPPTIGDIIITELSYNPCAAQGADGDCEYIVIQNNSADDIDLTGWAIGGGTVFVFPSGTIITAGQSLSIGASDNCAVANFDFTALDGSLGNSGETILILNSNGMIVSSYNYNDAFADGNCMAYCLDAMGVASECASSVYGEPVYDCPNLMAFIGDSCDDNNEMTVMDEVQLDCTCVGIIPTFDCPDEMVNLGDACDDGNDTTIGDMIVLGGDNPDFDESGTIVITSIPEGTDLTFTITSINGCSFDINVSSPACEPEPGDCAPNSGIFPWNGQ